MTIWHSHDLANALNIPVNHKVTGNIIQFNSNDVKPGDIFIALTGGVRDGHEFVESAIANGAAVAIVSKYCVNIAEDKILIVEDTFKALKSLALYRRSQIKAKVIAVTGSVGKTSTKEILLHMLSQFGPSFASRANFNNLLGVFINLASMPVKLDYVIFEVGMDKPGEIQELIGYIKPDLALINNILPVHMVNFQNLKGIADAKLEILEGLSAEGIAVFNRDSEFYEYSLTKAKELGVNKIFSFGEKKSSDGVLVEYTGDGIIGVANVVIGGKPLKITSPLLGHHRALNLTAALTIALALKLDTSKAAVSFTNLTLLRGRGAIINVNYKGYACQVVDEAYNASPEAMRASFNVLKELNHPYKIAVIGDMAELGENEIKLHTGLLPTVINSEVAKVHCIGHRMQHLFAMLPDNIRGNWYQDYVAALLELDNIIDREMMIMLKSSKSTKLSYIVDAIIKVGI